MVTTVDGVLWTGAVVGVPVVMEIPAITPLPTLAAMLRFTPPFGLADSEIPGLDVAPLDKVPVI